MLIAGPSEMDTPNSPDTPKTEEYLVPGSLWEIKLQVLDSHTTLPKNEFNGPF